MEFPTANNVLNLLYMSIWKRAGHIQCRIVIVMRHSVSLNLAKPVECRGKPSKHHTVRLTWPWIAKVSNNIWEIRQKKILTHKDVHEWCLAKRLKILGLQTKPVCRVSESYRGGQPKLLPTGLSWLRLTVIENKNVTGKLSSFFHPPAGRGFAQVFGRKDYSDTWNANNSASVILPTQMEQTEIVFDL